MAVFRPKWVLIGLARGFDPPFHPSGSLCQGPSGLPGYLVSLRLISNLAEPYFYLYLRTEPEIAEYNDTKQKKRELNDLLSRAIVLKAAELDRHRQYEVKKQRNEEEKMARVAKVRASKNRMDYTKTLTANFYVEPYEGEEEEGEYIEGRDSRSSSDGEEEEEEHRADPLNASSVKLTLPHSVRVPETMQVISMAKLMQKKVISPYLMHGDGGADSAHAKVW